ncbi:MAG TPA: DUF1059 domain-containing protein [Tepidiformaceae bacterium]|nr:DUF1059 domain-containing protein [Tepidiformaceae bacterium]
MTQHLSCIIPGCTAEFEGESEEQILQQVAQHAAKDHGMDRIDAPTVEKVRAAIRKR